jgi:hypothetical protein
VTLNLKKTELESLTIEKAIAKKCETCYEAEANIWWGFPVGLEECSPIHVKSPIHYLLQRPKKRERKGGGGFRWFLTNDKRGINLAGGLADMDK